MKKNYVEDIREAFRTKAWNDDHRGNGTIELRGVSFVADSPSIFGTPNQDYITAEIKWYESQDRQVSTLYDIYGKTVSIWDKVKDADGCVNSQYGHLLYSKDNHDQYGEVLDTLLMDPTSRQAVAYYARPSIHKDAGKDHICTTSVQYFIEHNYLEAVVNMRSNDAVYGYGNDIAWQRHVLAKLAAHLYVKPGPITWNCGSLHVYERHYNLIK